MPTRSLTEKERQAVMLEARAGRLFGIPLKSWSTTKCLSCAVAILYPKKTRQPCYCADCAEERGKPIDNPDQLEK